MDLLQSLVMTGTGEKAGRVRWGWGIPFVLVGVVFVVYWRGIFAGFVWDDQPFIVENGWFNPPTWGTIWFYSTHAFWNLYQPLTVGAWAALAWAGYVPTADETGNHLNPYLFHFGSIVFHVIAILAVYRLLRLVVKNRWAAMAGAGLFGLHPIQVEAAAFIGVLNNPLFASLALFALGDYVQACGLEKRDRRRGWLWGRGTLLFILSMLAKPTAVVVPVMAMALDWARNGRPVRAVIKSAIWWMVLAVPCVIWTKLNQPAIGVTNYSSPLFRPIVALDTLGQQLLHVAAPLRLTIDYGRSPMFLADHLGAIWTSAVMIVALVGLCVVGRGSRMVVAGVVVFVVGLLPNSGLMSFDFQQYSSVADRYVYLSMAGIALLFALLIANANRRGGFAIAVVVLLSYAVLTEMRLRVWRDGESLFRNAIGVNPRSWMSEINLALVVGDRSPDEAIELCRLAIVNNPKSWAAENNLASFLIDRSPADAVEHSKRAIALYADYPAAYCNLGIALSKMGDGAGGLAALAEAHRLDTGNEGFADRYAQALMAAGRYEEAGAVYRALQTRRPGSSVASAGLKKLGERLRRKQGLITRIRASVEPCLP